MFLKAIFGRTDSVKRAYLILFFTLLPTVFFLTNTPIWDDAKVFETHSHWSWEALFGPYLMSYWRPLTALTIALPNLAGVPVWANKLINVILFFIQGCLAISITDLYCQSKKMTRHSTALICVALLFALHPVFVESTLWLSARADLLLGIFVLTGVAWIMFTREIERDTQSVPFQFGGFFWGAAITALACGSKDTGLVWAGIGILCVFLISRKSTASWKLYWIFSGVGILTSVLAFLLLRSAVIGHAVGISVLVQRHALTMADRLQIFAEFILRSLVNIFLPYFDQAPFKAPGWFTDYSSTQLGILLLAVLALTGYAIFQVAKKHRTCGYFLLSAATLIVFHATLAVIADPTPGSILPDRYLAPGAALIFIALAILFVKQTPDTPNTSDVFPGVSKPVAMIVAVMLFQSLLIWTDARLAWGGNLSLWKSAWDHGSQSKMVAENYAGTYNENGNFAASRTIARFWIDSHPDVAITDDLCKIYLEVLEADVSLKDHEDGVRYANRALPIGSCHFRVTGDITFFLMQKQCAQVLPMIYKTISEGDKLEGDEARQFKQSEQRKKLLLDASYGEFRCGSKTKALELLNEVAQTDKSWISNGSKAQALINSATTNPR